MWPLGHFWASFDPPLPITTMGLSPLRSGLNVVGDRQSWGCPAEASPLVGGGTLEDIELSVSIYSYLGWGFVLALEMD